MCAAPGGKTSHVAMKMNNKGIVYAFDKHQGKVNGIKKLCELLGITNVIANKGDSANLVKKEVQEKRESKEEEKEQQQQQKQEEKPKQLKKLKKTKNTISFDENYFDRFFFLFSFYLF